MKESHQHRLLKVRAKAWLKSRGCKDIREEVSFLNGALIIDIVAYRDNKPVMGIECGTLSHRWDDEIYKRLPFPTFQLAYLAEPQWWWNKVLPFMGKPHRRITAYGVQPHKPPIFDIRGPKY